MRVISGKAKGRRLKRVPGDTTRPIMDRVKESLFNILSQEVAGSRWLDLFAGTGQVGIEALSRGAAEVVFVDNARAAIQTIRDNLEHTRLRDDATVVQADAFQILAGTPAQPYDVVYVAPPQYLGLWQQALQALDRVADQFLTAGGQVIIQIDPREYQPQFCRSLELTDERRYGNTLLLFYDYVPAEEARAA